MQEAPGSCWITSTQAYRLPGPGVFFNRRNGALLYCFCFSAPTKPSLLQACVQDRKHTALRTQSPRQAMTSELTIQRLCGVLVCLLHQEDERRTSWYLRLAMTPRWTPCDWRTSARAARRSSRINSPADAVHATLVHSCPACAPRPTRIMIDLRNTRPLQAQCDPQ